MTTAIKVIDLHGMSDGGVQLITRPGHEHMWATVRQLVDAMEKQARSQGAAAVAYHPGAIAFD